MTDTTNARSEPGQPAGLGCNEGLGPGAEALKREQSALRCLSYKTDAITARLEAIYRELERRQWTQ